MAEARYREGATGFQSLLDAQRVLVIAQNQYVLARGSVTLSLVALYKALGGGWNWSMDPSAVEAMSNIGPVGSTPPPKDDLLEPLPTPEDISP